MSEQNTDDIPTITEAQLRLNHSSEEADDISRQYLDESMTESEVPLIQAFAKLEFEDGEFYMTTYAIELGRDTEATREYEQEQESYEESDINPENQDTTTFCSDIENGSGAQVDRSHDGQSAEGARGAVNGDQVSANGNQALMEEQKQTEIRSANSSPAHRYPAESTRYSIIPRDYKTLALDSLDSSSFTVVNNGTLMPPPDLVPLIPIRPLVIPPESSGPKGISRKHIRIAFNFDEHLFQVEFLGRNGGFLDDVFRYSGSILPLMNGSLIQIGGVSIRFVLPDVSVDKPGAEGDMDSDSMSDEQHELGIAESIEYSTNVESEDDEPGVEEERPPVKKSVKQPKQPKSRVNNDKIPEAATPVPPKRRGPGRPPKNGVISKREQALLVRKAKEENRANADSRIKANEGRKLALLRGDGKTRNRKESQDVKTGESNLQPNGKRRYKKRKRAGENEESQVKRESTGRTESAPPEDALAAALPSKPPKKEKPVKPPRSPSPVYDESTMTPEQLARPAGSYVHLIHEALTNSQTGQMSLPQIYRAIERRYPFYKIRVQTVGWQSSVRHNLSQHPAFKKIERDGKGWMWGLVPDVPIEKDKKRRTTPPSMTPQQYYTPNHMMQQHYPYPGMPGPNNGVLPPLPYGMHPGIPPGRLPYPPPRPGLHLPLVNAQNESTYRSPYQSTPPPTTTVLNPQGEQRAPTNGINGHHPTSSSQPQPPYTPTHLQPQAGYENSPSKYPSSTPTIQVLTKHTHDTNQAISKFKAALIDTMDDKVRGELLVASAINRVLNPQAESSVPGGPSIEESTIMARFRRMLHDLEQKNMEAHGQAPNVVPPIPEARIGKSEQASASTEAAADKAAKVALTNGTADSVGKATESKEGTAPEGAVTRATANSQ